MCMAPAPHVDRWRKPLPPISRLTMLRPSNQTFVWDATGTGPAAVDAPEEPNRCGMSHPRRLPSTHPA
jgi:hypothetical protein